MKRDPPFQTAVSQSLYAYESMHATDRHLCSLHRYEHCWRLSCTGPQSHTFERRFVQLLGAVNKSHDSRPGKLCPLR